MMASFSRIWINRRTLDDIRVLDCKFFDVNFVGKIKLEIQNFRQKVFWRISARNWGLLFRIAELQLIEISGKTYLGR